MWVGVFFIMGPRAGAHSCLWLSVEHCVCIYVLYMCLLFIVPMHFFTIAYFLCPICALFMCTSIYLHGKTGT